jgi:hypothetical protein
MLMQKVHQGSQGLCPGFLFGDNARHEEANFAYSHVNGDWYQVKTGHEQGFT